MEHIDISKLPQPSDKGHWLYKRIGEMASKRHGDIADKIGVSRQAVTNTLLGRKSRRVWKGLVEWYLECLRVEMEVKKYDQSIYN